MSSEIASEVEELRGRLTALYVCCPDVEGRLKPVTEHLQILLDSVKVPETYRPGLMKFVVNDLCTLNVQLAAVYEQYPQLRKELRPILELMGKLLSV